MPTAQEVRDSMLKYWKDNVGDGSDKAMIMDTDSVAISKEEVPEIMALLPDLTGKDVLDLGAGIGRFTGELAKRAKSVVAVDFIQEFLDKNRERNSHHKNIKYVQGDATKLDEKEASYDLVFSNGLMMYLSDEEMHVVANNLLRWVKPDGLLFFRESCSRPGGNQKRDFNPSQYREPGVYTALFQSVQIPAKTGKGSYGFDPIIYRSIQAFIKLKNSRNQKCWLLHKVERDEKTTRGYNTFQEFLDNQQYTKKSLLRYEKMYGHGYISTGGPETTVQYVPMLDLKPDQLVLDVGCGVGGGDFYIAQTFGCKVIGVDLSYNMTDIAQERADAMGETRVTFEVADATKREFKEGSFDVVYCRDAMMHIAEKRKLLSLFYKWLKPGGKCLITDYATGEGELSQEFKDYVVSRNYSLISVSAFRDIMLDLGFIKVQALDKTDQYVSILKKELARCQGENKQEFVKEFTEEGLQTMVNGWKDKVRRCGQGDHHWALFYAEKATAK